MDSDDLIPFPHEVGGEMEAPEALVITAGVMIPGSSMVSGDKSYRGVFLYDGTCYDAVSLILGHMEKSEGSIKMSRGKDEEERVLYLSEPDSPPILIPASELAPGMICVDHPEHGPAWVAESSVEWTGVSRRPVTEEERDALRLLQRDLADVFPRSLEEWEEELSTATDPDDWMMDRLLLRAVYQALNRGEEMDLPKRSAVFRVLKAAFSVPPEHALKVVDYAPLSLPEARGVIAAMLKLWELVKADALAESA